MCNFPSRVIALSISIAGIVVLNTSKPAAAADNSWFKTYLVAHGGCTQLLAGTSAFRVDADSIQRAMSLDLDKVKVFGKRLLDWSDEPSGVPTGYP